MPVGLPVAIGYDLLARSEEGQHLVAVGPAETGDGPRGSQSVRASDLRTHAAEVGHPCVDVDVDVPVDGVELRLQSADLRRGHVALDGDLRGPVGGDLEQRLGEALRLVLAHAHRLGGLDEVRASLLQRPGGVLRRIVLGVPRRRESVEGAEVRLAGASVLVDRLPVGLEGVLGVEDRALVVELCIHATQSLGPTGAHGRDVLVDRLRLELKESAGAVLRRGEIPLRGDRLVDGVGVIERRLRRPLLISVTEGPSEHQCGLGLLDQLVGVHLARSSLLQGGRVDLGDDVLVVGGAGRDVVEAVAEVHCQADRAAERGAERTGHRPGESEGHRVREAELVAGA